jgi:hypothetical protein
MIADADEAFAQRESFDPKFPNQTCQYRSHTGTGCPRHIHDGACDVCKGWKCMTHCQGMASRELRSLRKQVKKLEHISPNDITVETRLEVNDFYRGGYVIGVIVRAGYGDDSYTVQYKKYYLPDHLRLEEKK